MSDSKTTKLLGNKPSAALELYSFCSVKNCPGANWTFFFTITRLSLNDSNFLLFTRPVARAGKKINAVLRSQLKKISQGFSTFNVQETFLFFK